MHSPCRSLYIKISTLIPLFGAKVIFLLLILWRNYALSGSAAIKLLLPRLPIDYYLFRKLKQCYVYHLVSSIKLNSSGYLLNDFTFSLP